MKDHKLYFNDQSEYFAHQAWKNLKLDLPVDLSVVANKLSIVVEEREFDESIDGLYLRMPGAPAIIAINSSYVKPISRRRFTLAHEIGHHLLCHKITPDKRLFFLDSSRPGKSNLEFMCDKFAALLLMPEELIRKHFDELSYNINQRLDVLADRFGVSKWAMRRRLKELGLFTPFRFYKKQDD